MDFRDISSPDISFSDQINVGVIGNLKITERMVIWEYGKNTLFYTYESEFPGTQAR